MSKPRERFLIISIAVLVVVAAGFFAYIMHRRAVTRNASPVISCASDEIRVSVNASREDLLVGVTAMDAEDGDLTGSIIIESISQFVEKGKCTITYATFDSGNKVATASRTLYYTDYHSPRFELLSDLVYPAGTSATPLRSIRAYDCFDGDITNRISMTVINPDELGRQETRQVEFRVINSHGDVATLRANIVTDERASLSDPEIELSTYLVYIEKGGELDPLSFVEHITLLRQVYTPEEFGVDALDADMSQFDANVPGQYRIPIYCEEDGHVGSTALYVVVEDTAASAPAA